MSFLNKNTLSDLMNGIEHSVKLPPPQVSILGYHAISPENTIVDIKIEMFMKQLAFRKKHCQLIPLDQVISFIQGKETFTKPAVALTFDDGYLDIMTTVSPILVKEKIPATLFVMSDLAHVNRLELANEKKLLSIKDIKYLQKLGFTIGCHTATHANLASKDADLEREILLSKKRLEKSFNTKT